MKKLKLRAHQIIVILKYCFYWCYCKIKRIKNEDVWLISERGDEARDNGYALYKYLIEEHNNIPFKYVISKESTDIKHFQNLEHIVYYGSKEHYILFITAGILISTHVMGFSPEFRIFNKLDKWKLVKIKGKRVFLGHGINKDECVGLHYGNIYADLLISGAKPEYEFMHETYGYKEGSIVYTGLPRYDTLKDEGKKQILIMPTWRMNLFYCPNEEEFQKTEYFKHWYGLLKNKELESILREHNYQLYFYPHYEIQPFIKAFEVESDVVTICDFDHYDVQTLLKESKLLITDYSSVFFDFAYMNKPTIYYQFDYKEYRGEHFKEGFFSYIDNGFGAVLEKEEDVVKEIKNLFDQNFLLEEKYQKNRDLFFTLSKEENCKRVYDAIKKLEKDEK